MGTIIGIMEAYAYDLLGPNKGNYRSFVPITQYLFDSYEDKEYKFKNDNFIKSIENIGKNYNIFKTNCFYDIRNSDDQEALDKIFRYIADNPKPRNQ